MTYGYSLIQIELIYRSYSKQRHEVLSPISSTARDNARNALHLGQVHVFLQGYREVFNVLVHGVKSLLDGFEGVYELEDLVVRASVPFLIRSIRNEAFNHRGDLLEVFDELLGELNSFF